MANVKVKGNERSEVIDVITTIHDYCKDNDLMINDAGGEKTVSNNGKSMFPDVILYGDASKTVILQGWECKMPDTPIEDQTNIDNAKNKALTLNLNSFMIWNFSYGVLYQRKNKTDRFEQVKMWSTGIDTEHFISNRKDVDTYKDEWKELLERIIIEINNFFVKGEFISAPLGDIIADTAISTIIERNREITAEHLKKNATSDSIMEAYIEDWWSDYEQEYKNDEKDKYYAYSKYILLNWSNRILFAHIIKAKQNAAFAIDSLDEKTTPNDANNIFKEITDKCDFFNVFEAPEYNNQLHIYSWNDMVEFSIFLKDHSIDSLQQETLQNILEKTVSTSRREINGQYATPYELAKILLQLTVKNWTGTVLDCCCGTGTIPRVAIDIKKEKGISAKDALESVWACDKYNYPLQAANLSMVSSDTINIANRLFKHNALSLKVNENILITNPTDGSKINLNLPLFDNVVSNLPFVSQENISADDLNEISNNSTLISLDGRSDLYAYIALKISDILKSDGKLGLIVSNSWLGTIAGKEFFKALTKSYCIKQIHISGNGRWFNNADVVTTLIIAEKKNSSSMSRIHFWLWKKPLDYYEKNREAERTLVNSALLEKEKDCDIAALSNYSYEEINRLIALNISYNSLFHNVSWLLKLTDYIIPINSIFHVFRGSRRGWDPLFYPTKGNHNIEPEFLKKVLKNAKKIESLVIDADSSQEAFCCGEDLNKLLSEGKMGAYSWIKKFENQVNKVGKPLPQVLRKPNHKWYELKTNEISELVTMMNPDQRFFFARFNTPSFINQRLIGLNHREQYSDIDLNHALLNSLITIFFIEASGFGRGLGVLDINKDSIAECYMLNPSKVDDKHRKEIIQTFNVIKNRKMQKIQDELKDKARIDFELAVLRSYGLESYFDNIKNSLLSMISSRLSVKK